MSRHSAPLLKENVTIKRPIKFENTSETGSRPRLISHARNARRGAPFFQCAPFHWNTNSSWNENLEQSEHNSRCIATRGRRARLQTIIDRWTRLRRVAFRKWPPPVVWGKAGKKNNLSECNNLSLFHLTKQSQHNSSKVKWQGLWPKEREK